MKNNDKTLNSASTRDEYLREVTIGELKAQNAPIILVNYNPEWVELYNREADRIRFILGHKVLQLEHVGSTSVAGLCAKAIIDILLVVEDSTDESSYVAPMEAAGYKLQIREPDWFQHRLLKGPDTDINLHVFSPGAPEIKRMLQFRDWLRNNERDRKKYANAKRELAQNIWPNTQNYADAKTDIVSEIMGRASSDKNII